MLLLGLIASHLILQSKTWFGAIHTQQISVDFIVLAIIIFSSAYKPRWRLRIQAAQIIYLACIPALITHSVMKSTHPVYGAFQVFAIGLFVPVLLTSMASSGFNRPLDIFLYIFGRQFAHVYALYPTGLAVLVYRTRLNLKQSSALILASLLLFTLQQSYLNPSDITLIHTLYNPSLDSNFKFPYKLLDSQQSITGRISIIEDSSTQGGIRIMKCDHSILGGVFLAHGNLSIFQVFNMLDFVRGVGVGITAIEMVKSGVEVDSVEIDPAVDSFAEKWFGYSSAQGTSGKLNRYVMDAVQFVDETKKKYDYIVHDVFSGGSVHPSLFSIEFLKTLKTKLKIDGTLALNFFGFAHSKAFKAVEFSILLEFQCSRVYADSTDQSAVSNIVFYASDRCPLVFVFDELLEKTVEYRSIARGFDKLEVNFVKSDKANIDIGALSLQHDSALAHWRIMRQLFPPIFWLSY